MPTHTIASSAPQAQVQTPQVWDKPTVAAQVGDEIRAPFTPMMRVVEREVLADGRVRLLVKPISASYSEEWVLDPEPIVKQQQPANATRDSVAHQPQPDWEALAEYDSGCIHGKHDAAARMSPMCKQASCPYSRGYFDGYSVQASSQPPVPDPKAVEWQVVYDPKWDVYQVWIGERCLREKATSASEGERIAQKYMAAEELRRQHRQLVMSAFAA